MWLDQTPLVGGISNYILQFMVRIHIYMPEAVFWFSYVLFVKVVRGIWTTTMI